MTEQVKAETGLRPLRLIAFDAEDLGVISAHLQDALVRFGDMIYLPQAKRFALVANRFDWCVAASGRMERCRTGLHFDRVERASISRIPNRSSAAILNLLSIGFDEADPPGGFVLLNFSGGGSLRLTVECLEAQMSDLGPRWPTRRKPGHSLDGPMEAR